MLDGSAWAGARELRFSLSSLAGCKRQGSRIGLDCIKGDPYHAHYATNTCGRQKLVDLPRDRRDSRLKGKGDLFELLTKHYLLLNPTYNTTLSDVWLLDEVPEKLRASLNLPQGDGH